MLEELRNWPQPQTPEDLKALELFSRHVKATGNDGKFEAMVECSKPYLSALPELFDRDPNLFNCNNKTIDLSQRKARDFEQSDLITKSCGVDFIPGSECHTWDRFIYDIFLGRQEIIDFVQRFVGYAMTTSTKEQCMFILHGDGRNGKTVFIETLRKLFGDYVETLPASTIVRKQNEGIPNDIAGLKGARLVTTVETNENVTLDESLIKKITGSDIIKARFLHKEFFEFHPTFKIIFASNHKPNIHATDNGIWRRIRMIPFDLKIDDQNDDRNLQEKLTAELPGILLWAIEGYKKWADNGLTKPDVIMETTEIYRYEEDSIGQFIEDECVVDDNFVVPCKEFKARIQAYNKYLTQKKISEYMRKKGFLPPENRRIVKESQVRCYIGLRLKEFYESDPSHAHTYSSH
jgi:putative DNA primase/helicase